MATPEASAPPLEGIKVVDFSQMLAGPAAALWLADYGAEVVKIEPPEGDSGRALRSAAAAHLDPPPMFGAYNRNKTAARLDLKAEKDRAIAWRLIADADVILESGRPGVMEGLGFGCDDVRDRFPSIVFASVSGFGWGPEARRLRGVDLVIQAESGVMAITGHRDGPPTKVGFTVIDAACGHALCHGILAALFRRERTGVGSQVRISLYDVALNLQAAPLSEFLYTGTQPLRFGNSAAHTSPADMFNCADGPIILVAYLDAHWRKLLDILDDDSLRDDPRFADPQTRVIHRDLLTERLAAHLRERPAQEWIERLSAAGILVARVKDYHDVTTAAVTDESGILFEDGGFHAVRSPVQLIGTKTPVPAPLQYAEAADLADQFRRGSAPGPGTANRNEEPSMSPDGPRLETIQAEAAT